MVEADSPGPNMVPLIANGEQISVEWMRQAFSAGGVGDPSVIGALEVERLSDATNAIGTLFRCRLTGGKGRPADPASVIVKLPATDATPFRFAKWLSLYRREYVFYRHVAPEARLRAPTLFYGDFDERSHRFVLVIEDLGEMEMIPQFAAADPPRALAAVREIAQFQGRFWEGADAPALAHCGEFLNARERRIMQMVYMLTAAPALDRFGDLFPASMRRLAVNFGSRIEAHFAAVAKGPKTIVHGDYRSENMMFEKNAEDLAIIDWQGCGLGCGMFDVSYFLGTSVSIDNRRRIEREAVETYHDAVCRAGAADYTLDDCWRSYRQNMLGALMHCVIGCGALEMDNAELLNQSKELLRRILAAIEDLDAGEFLPAPARPLSSAGMFSTLSKLAYRTVGFSLRLRGHKSG